MVNSLKKTSLRQVPINKISLVKNGNHFRIIAQDKNRVVNVNNKNLTRNQMRQITARLSKNNLINRVFYLQNRVNNANSLEKFINTFRIAYPTNDPNAAPLRYIVSIIAPNMYSMTKYKPYINIKKRKANGNFTKTEYIRSLKEVSKKFNSERNRIQQILRNLNNI